MRDFSSVKNKRIAVGLMSGTSVDGIDAAVIEIEGILEPKVTLLAFENTSYQEEIRKKIFALFDPKTSTAAQIAYMDFLLGELYAGAALAVTAKAGICTCDVDVVGSHGQTIYHEPAVNGNDGFDIRCTMQIGEGAVIARRMGVPCVSDFRTADMAAGGQGAPLVPFTEYELFRQEETILLQNIGGISNLTVLPGSAQYPDSRKRVFAFDTGPGNMVIDGLMERLYGLTFDRGGAIGAAGSIHKELYEKLRDNAYFEAKPPKSTGRELFGAAYMESVLNIMNSYQIAKEDVIATVSRLTAWSTAHAYRRYIMPQYPAARLITGGGGSYNKTLISMLAEEFAPLGVQVSTQEEQGGNSDAKEAVAFALLADRTMLRLPNCISNVTGAAYDSVLGKISYPGVTYDNREY